ncbi:hypothetical protein ACFWIN_19840 [Streptomyces sp. NPDC127049]|uniref:hypothetical protein n=1 Tax=Streptomyces sp. NPDC127049 TaxID=3347118 RepID=UPI00365DA484
MSGTDPGPAALTVDGSVPSASPGLTVDGSVPPASPGLTVDRSVPPTSPGLLGRLERFMGPGKTRAESAVEAAGVGLGAVLLVAGTWSTGALRGWSGLQLAVAALIALDLLGGILTNATNAAKRWYHRPRPGARRARLLFVSAHLLHLAVVATLLLDGDPGWFLGTAGLLLAGALLVEYAPVPLRRPVAMGAYTAAVLTGFFWLTVPPALIWFGPLFFLKLLVCHLVPEAPLADSRAGDGTAES